MAERITGGQCALYITGANAAGVATLPAGLFSAADTFDIDPTFTYENHNEIGNPRTVRQQTEQTVKVTFTGGVVNEAGLLLAANQSSNFLNKGGTPKYHISIQGNGSDASFNRSARWCTLDDVKMSAPAGNKTLTNSISFTGEDII